MQIKSNKKLSLAIFIMSVIIIVSTLNLIFGILLENTFFDTSSDKSYSLSDASKQFLARNKKDISIRYYVSKDIKSQDAALWQYSQYLQRLFEQYQNYSKGKITLIPIEVTPFSNSEASAKRAGLEEIGLSEGNRHLYIGASFTDSDGQNISVPSFSLQRKEIVEDDITRILSVLSEGNDHTIGIISPYFKIAGENLALNPTPNWPFIKQLQMYGYNIKNIRSTIPVIDDDIDILLLYYPLNTDQKLLYAIDQYLMRGGKLIVFLDTFSINRFQETEQYVSYDSGLNSLLKNYGIEYVENTLVGNNQQNRPIVIDNQKVSYPFKTIISASEIMPHTINDNISELFVDHSGYFNILSNTPDVQVLFSTTSKSGQMSTDKIVDISYNSLIKNYHSTQKKYPLAVLVKASPYSIFSEALANPETTPFISLSLKPSQVLAIADADMMSEIAWNKNSGKQAQTKPFSSSYTSDNILFLRNAIDYMTQSNYTSVPKKQTVSKQSLHSAIYKFVFANNANEYNQTNDNLLDIRRKAEQIKNNLAGVSGTSQKRLKDLEDILRTQEEVSQKLRQIEYKIKSAYQQTQTNFNIAIIVGLPLLVIIMIFVIYLCYEKYIKSQARGLINEQ